MQEGIYSYNLPFSNEMYSVRALVEHAMEELAHVMFMYHLEYVLGSLHRIMREHQITLGFTEPVSRTDRNSSNVLSQLLNQHKHSSLSTSNIFSNNNNVNNNSNKIESWPSSASLLSSVYGIDKKENMNSKNLKSIGTLSGNIFGTLNPIKIAHGTHSSGSALYLESTNYDNFARVIPVARLLNSPKIQSTSSSSNLSSCTQSRSTVYNDNGNNNPDDKESNTHPEHLTDNENICASKISSLCSVMRDTQLQQRIRID